MTVAGHTSPAEALKEAITERAEFDIGRIREEMVVLIDNLAKVYKEFQARPNSEEDAPVHLAADNFDADNKCLDHDSTNSILTQGPKDFLMSVHAGTDWEDAVYLVADDSDVDCDVDCDMGHNHDSLGSRSHSSKLNSMEVTTEGSTCTNVAMLKPSSHVPRLIDVPYVGKNSTDEYDQWIQQTTLMVQPDDCYQKVYHAMMSKKRKGKF